MQIGFDKVKQMMDEVPKLYRQLASPQRSMLLNIFMLVNILLYGLAGTLLILKAFQILD